MHILHLIKTSEGASWAINQIKEIKRRFPEITFSVIIPDGGIHIIEYYEVCRDVYLFDYKLNHTIFNRGLEFKKIVINDNPDIIHSWFTQTTLYARFFLRNSKVPRLFQVVGPLHLENKIFKFFDIKSAQQNDYWIATSKYILNKYRTSNVGEDKLFLNYAYIHIEKLLREKETVAIINFRNKYGIPANYKIIGTASYIYPPKFYEKTGVKGHEKLLEVFRAILEVRKDVVLIIAGKTFGDKVDYENKLKQIALAIDKDRILFTGAYKNVFSVIANFDVFVYLSKSENLGGVFESLLFEVPTISSDRGELPELVLNNETGYNVSLENNVIIKERILKMLNSENEDFKKNGKERVQQLFDEDTIINKAYAIYVNVGFLNSNNTIVK